MKRILLISNHGLGFYNFKKELVLELLMQGYEVHFVVPQFEKLVELTKVGAIYHEITVDRRGMNPLKDVGFIKQLNKIIKNVNPNVVMFHTIKPNIYGSFIAKLRGIPYINNITGLGSALQSNSRLAIVLRLMYKISLNKSQGVFFENQGNLEYFQNYRIGNKNKYVVVKGAGVNTEHFKPIETQISFGASESKEKNKGVIFLFIARIMREKGAREYLQAAKVISETYKDVEFQMLGDYDEPELKSMVEEYERKGCIKYLGASEDTRNEMRDADCIVLPSYHEGMSNVLLEGASMGMPLITTDVPGCREAVVNMKTGILCKAQNAESLVEAIKTFLSFDRMEQSAMGLKGREKMISEFDRKLVINEYIKCIKATL